MENSILEYLKRFHISNLLPRGNNKMVWQWKLLALSDIWRNLFYAGLVAHKLLDGDVVKGS